jgi:hypothetical protein
MSILADTTIIPLGVGVSLSLRIIACARTLCQAGLGLEAAAQATREGMQIDRTQSLTGGRGTTEKGQPMGCGRGREREEKAKEVAWGKPTRILISILLVSLASLGGGGSARADGPFTFSVTADMRAWSGRANATLASTSEACARR